MGEWVGEWKSRWVGGWFTSVGSIGNRIDVGGKRPCRFEALGTQEALENWVGGWVGGWVGRRNG